MRTFRKLAWPTSGLLMFPLPWQVRPRPAVQRARLRLAAVAGHARTPAWMSSSGRLAGAGLARSPCVPRQWPRKRPRSSARPFVVRAPCPGPPAASTFDAGWEDCRAAKSRRVVLDSWTPQQEVGLARDARARQRRQVVPPEQRRTVLGLSYLERASLKRTLPRYAELWADFVRFAQQRGVKLGTTEAIDEAGALFLNEKYFAGELPGLAGYLTSAIKKFKPQVVRAGRGALARTLAAAKGFRNLCPAQTKQPLPWEAACQLVRQLCRQEQAEMGLAVVLAYALYLRANEMLLCRVGQLTPPIRGGGKAHRCWCLVLHPSERGQRSKVGMADEAMRIEGDEFKFLGPILRRWLKGRGREEPLFSFDYARLSRAFREAGEKSGLGVLGPPTLHQLRHGGASTDAASGSKGLMEIQAKGRWGDARSVRRYAKGGRVTQQLWQLDAKTRRECLAAARAIGGTLTQSLWPSRRLTDPAR